MKNLAISVVSFLTLLLVDQLDSPILQASALQLPIKGRRVPQHISSRSIPPQARRAQPTELENKGNEWRKGRILSPRQHNAHLTNLADISYHTNITLGGEEFDALIDTGSSDLWVAGSVPNSRLTGFTAGVNYAVGSVRGPIKTAIIEFAGYSVPDQAFLEIQPDEENRPGDGLIGLGPNVGSKIIRQMGPLVGAPVLDRIFLQNTSTPNFMTVLMGRKEDPTDFFSGMLTIGEVLSEYRAVVNEPRLLVSDVPIHEIGDQHFQILLDEDGLTGPDGNVIEMRTRVDETGDKKRAMAVVDTGFSLPQLPKSASDAIYGKIDGAEFGRVDNIGEVWILPCGQEVNITFKFGGQKYPIHPLDTSLDPSLLGLPRVRNSQGQSCCIGTFQPFSFETGVSPNYDIILGMAFLRNVYMLVDYGDFVVGSTERDDPFIQLLSTTDPVEAHNDFVQVRLHGVETTPDQGLEPSNTDGHVQSHAVYYVIAVVCTVGVLALIGCIILYRRRKSKPRKNGQLFPPPSYEHSSSPLLASSNPPSIQSHTRYAYQYPTYPIHQPQHVNQASGVSTMSAYHGSQ